MSMNLKPYRDYSEHFVQNGFFSLNSTGSKGSLVQMLNFVPGTPVIWDAGANLAPGIQGVYSHRPTVPNKVRLAASGALGSVLGMLLYDVLEVNPTNQALLLYGTKERQDELQCVLSGQASPIVTKGFFEVVGMDVSAGAPGPGSGIGLSNSGSGIMSVLSEQAAATFGKYLTPTGKDGSAVIFLDVK